MIVDFDDYCEDQHRLDLLHALREANPKFRCTLFAIPGRGSDAFWDETPEWCELAVHGWMHPNPDEARDWSYEQMVGVMEAKPARFVEGFKAPGWQVSEGTYLALRDAGWWLADHYRNTARIPDGLRRHVITIEAANGIDPKHWHGHIPNVCGNGIEETFSALIQRVREADSFQLISEVV
jgi:hypothetical protein